MLEHPGEAALTDLSDQLEQSIELVQQRKKMSEQQQQGIVRVDASSGALDFSSEQVRLLREGYAPGASDVEFRMLLEVAAARRLNPFLKQIHFVKRKSKDDNGNWRETWTSQVSIDGLRAIAQRTGLYDGQDEPEYELNKDGLIVAARVKVYRKDWSRPSVGVARWDEYVQTNRDGKPTKFWENMPHVMIAKCAEALALRKAFPEDMSGLVTDDEMMQADSQGGIRKAKFGAPPQPAPVLSLSPHSDSREEGAGDEALFADLKDKLEDIKALLPSCNSYDRALALRSVIGTKAQQSELTKRIQVGGESGALTTEMRMELGKLWQHCDRQVAKLEKELATGPEDAIVGDERQPGEDREEDLL